MRRLLILALTLAISHQPFGVSSSLAKETDADMPLGGINASLQPDLFTGALTGSIPIEVPPGRNGMQPNLILSYASSSGNGWLGMGWKLEMGAIERQTRWGVLYNPTAAEEQSGKVYTFRLNGVSSDLVQDTTDPFLYHAKFEGSFFRIKKLSVDGTAGWEVTDKKGTKYTFGATYRIQSASMIFKWCLERVEDRDGKFMSITYTSDQGQSYLDTVTYTGYGDGVGVNAPMSQVKFYLEDTRPDKLVMYSSNFPITTAKRLRTIEVRGNGNLVRVYKLQYSTSMNTSRSLLSSFQEYGKDATLDGAGTGTGTVTGGTALPTVASSYVNEPNGTFGPQQATDFAYGNWSGYQLFFADVNGDGKTDHCAVAINTSGWSSQCGLSKGDGTFNPQQPTSFAYGNWSGYQIYFADVNGDGMADQCAIYMGISGWSSQCGLSIGDGKFSPQQPTSFATGNWSGRQLFLADVNGDGKTDQCSMYIGTAGWSGSCGLSIGDGKFGAMQSTSFAYGNWSGYQLFFADVNGDGKTDHCAVAINTSGWSSQCGLSKGDGTFNPQQPTSFAYGNWSGYQIYFADVNGDGMADQCAIYMGISGWSSQCGLSIGDGKFSPQQPTSFATGNWSGRQLFLADVNGDGKTDQCSMYIGTAGWSGSCGLNNGDGTFGGLYSTSFAYGNWTGYQLFFADVNGDGKTDHCAVAINTSGWTSQCGVSSGGAGMLLHQVDNGLGGTTTIEYLPSTQPQFQNLPGALPYPVQTVSSLTTADGNGNSSTTTYAYTNGYHQIGERDFRGFKTATVTSPGGTDAEKTVTTTEFLQGRGVVVSGATTFAADDPSVLGEASLKGRPFRVTVSKKTDMSFVFSRVETSYYDNRLGPTSTAPFFNPPAVSLTSIYDSAGALAKQTQTESVTYDAYGNVTLAYNRGDFTGNNAITSDDTTTVVAFNNYDTTNWLVAFPTVTTSYAGLGTSGTKLSETKLYYDGASSCTTPAGNLTPTKGHVTKVERWLNGGTNPISGMEYNAYGGLTCTRDLKGNTSMVAYDPTSTFPLTSTNALGHVTTTSYYGVNGVAMDTGLYGQAKSVTDPNGKTTTTTYDALGRKLTATTPDGLVNTMAYNYGGTFSVGTQNIQSTTSGGGLTTNLVSKTYFDGLGRTTKKESPGAADGSGALKVLVTETQYDVRGLVAQTSLPYIQGAESATGRWRTMTYDVVGRMIQSTNPDGTSSQVCYNGWTTTSLDPKLHKKVETKDALGRLITVQEYSGQATTGTCAGGTLYATTNYAYDLLGNLLSVTDTKGNVSSMTYDTLNRKLTMHDPDMGNWSYSYDANGNLLTQVDAKNQKLCFTYDALNRRTQKNYGTTTVACGTDTVVYTYDDTVAANNGKGRLKQVTDPAQSVTFQYDSRGRIAQSAKTLDGTTYYTTTSAYDGLGRLTSVNYPTTPITTVTYTYDGPQLKSVLEGATTYVTYGGWNALRQPATATFGNGVVTTNTYANTNNAACTQQTFRLCTLTTQKGATPFYQDLRYDYEANGNVWNIYDSTVAGNAGDQHFAYDDLDRLTLANGPYGASGANASLIYQYDEIGNLTLNSQVSATAYGYPASGSSSVRPHAVSTAGANSYTYDNNGNMLTGAGRTYTWNQENKPLTIVQGGTTTTFVYDGDGGRAKKIVGTTTTRYISKLYECDNTNCSRFVWAGSTRIATIASNGSLNYWHGDHLGSSSVITDATGNKVETITYYPFGGTRTNQSPSTPAIDVPYKYTGKELDASTGLYYYEARYYDATLARFISPDAIAQNPRDPQSENRYSYVGNNPLKYIDPTGHNKCFIGVCFSKKDIQTVKMVGTVVVVAAASYFTAGAASGLLQSALFQTVTAGLTNQALIGATIIAYAPTINAVGMIAGGLAGGAIGGAVGGAILGGDLSSTVRGAMVGGLSGAFAGGVGSFTQGWGAFGTISARGISGGVGSIIGGGRFEQGFASGLIGGSMSEAYQGMANETDWLKRKAGGPQFADMFGNLWTSGERGIEGGGKPPSIFGWITMGLESSGPSSNASLWDAFTNAVSKTHDFGNSWGYNYETGKSVNFGLLGNSLTDVWSMSTMVPAAAYTIGAMTNGGIAEGVARGLLKK